MEKSKGTGRGDGKSIPFYELPSHIKPCSKIIQETRMQLQYSKGGLLSRDGGVGDGKPLGRMSSSGLEDMDMKGHSAIMRPVDTKRPFTPRDSTSLWGVSSRKRPPSAITLSRLSIPFDDTEEMGSGCSVPTSALGNISGRGAKGLESRNNLGTLSCRSAGSLPGIREAENDESSDAVRSLSATQQRVEKARLQMKSLSLHSGQSKSKHDFYQDLSNSKKPRRSSSLGPIDDDAKEHETFGSFGEHYIHIHNLEVAAEYLQSFVNEYSTPDKPPKSDVILVLKRMRDSFCKTGKAEESIPQKLRKRLLELIFKLVEKNPTDTDIMFWSSFVLLHCNIIGNNLTTVFKMVFKSSKCHEFKSIIVSTEYLEVLMKSLSQVCPKTQTDSMIYGYGTLKFLCEDASVLNRLIDMDLIPIMGLHLKILNCEMKLNNDSSGRASEGVLNGAFQLTSILRSVIGESHALINVVQSGLLEQVCVTMFWALNDVDLLTNIARILSVASMHPGCSQVICVNLDCPTLVRIMKQWYEKDDIMVRLMYFLGNLLANSDDVRLKLLDQPGVLPCILKIMSYHLERASHTPDSLDILVKTTRVIANWVLNAICGSEICNNARLSIILNSILELRSSSEELKLCVLCALNNISFYINYTDLGEGTMKTAEFLFRNVGQEDAEVRAEMVKVLGNLTRNDDVRKMSAIYMENVLLNLDDIDASPELLCATCGILINIVIEEQVKEAFLQQSGLERVSRLLEHTNDLMDALITSQVIWNLVISNENQGQSLKECITPPQSSYLQGVLQQKLSICQTLSENLESGTPCDVIEHQEGNICNCQSNLLLIAEDFRVVASDLLAKLA